MIHGGPGHPIGSNSTHVHLVADILVLVVYTLLKCKCVVRVGGTSTACRALDRSRLAELVDRANARIRGLRRHGSRLAGRLRSLGTTTGGARRTRHVTGRGRRAGNVLTNHLPTANGNISVDVSRKSGAGVSTTAVCGLVRRLHGTNTRIVTVGDIHIIAGACIDSASSKLRYSNITLHTPCQVLTVNSPRGLRGTIGVTNNINSDLGIGCNTAIDIASSSSVAVDRVHGSASGACTETMR